MKIAILTEKPNSSFAKNFRETQNYGVDVEIIDFNECQLSILCNSKEIFYKNSKIGEKDILLYSPELYSNEFALDIIKHFESKGTKVLNGTDIISKCQNRYKMIQSLSEIHDIEIPKSVLIKDSHSFDKALDIVGGFPTIMKLTSFNNNLLGSYYASELKDAEMFLDLNFSFAQFFKGKKNIILQEFIINSVGNVVKCLIIGKRVVQTAFSNKIFMDKLKPLDLEKIKDYDSLLPEKRTLAINIAEEFNLDYGVITLLNSEDKNLVLEINPFPSFDDVEIFDGIPIYEEVKKYLMAIA